MKPSSLRRATAADYQHTAPPAGPAREILPAA
jgi:hypothetical protein